MSLIWLNLSSRKLRLVNPATGGDVADSIRVEVQDQEVGQSSQRGNIADLVGLEVQDLEVGQSSQRGNIADLVIVEGQDLKVDQFSQRGNIADLVIFEPQDSAGLRTPPAHRVRRFAVLPL